MGNLANLLCGITDKLRSRAVSAVMLMLICSVAAVAVVANLNSVSIDDGGEVKTVITMRRDTKAILTRAGYAISVNDRIVENSEGENSKEIVILRAFPVTVVSGGEVYNIETVGGTVYDIIEESRVGLPDADDVVTPSDLNTMVTEGMEIIIDRVEYTEKTTEEKVAYSTKKTKTNTLDKGKTKVSVKGQDGVKQVVTRYKYVNGKLTGSEVVSSKVTKEPVTEEILVGTKVKSYTTGKVTVDNNSNTITVNGKTITYKKKLTGTGTAYTASAGAICSTGRPAKVGNVAVNPNVIPYGTKLYITSADGKYVYGYAVAADTGGALMSGRVLCDLYMNTKSECINFGRRKINVYVLG